MNKNGSTRKLFLKISLYIEKIFRTPVLKNIFKRFLLRVFLKRFPTWTNNLGSEEDVWRRRFLKKNCPT